MYIVKYWLKLKHSDNIIIKYAYKYTLEDCENGKKNWATDVKRILHEFGFMHVREYPHLRNPNIFVHNFK